jgi:1-acyl-sn-glycerol-3-phosphate acyltransferase
MRSTIAEPAETPSAFATIVGLPTFALGVLLCFLLQLPLALLTWPLDRRRLVTGRLYRLTAVAISTLCPGLKFRIHGPLPPQLPARSVFVSNHESQADVFLISRLPWEMKWLGKASLFKIPVLGWGMWLAGDIPIERGDPASKQKAMARCRRIVESGVPVMMFPEGTRSATGELLPFKTGAFRLAIEAGASIVPIAVFGTREALPKHSLRVGRSKAWVTVGSPISTEGMTLDDVTRLSDQARAQIQQLLATLREKARSA